jgi:hypothetical protein
MGMAAFPVADKVSMGMVVEDSSVEDMLLVDMVAADMAVEDTLLATDTAAVDMIVGTVVEDMTVGRDTHPAAADS